MFIDFSIPIVAVKSAFSFLQLMTPSVRKLTMCHGKSDQVENGKDTNIGRYLCNK